MQLDDNGFIVTEYVCIPDENSVEQIKNMWKLGKIDVVNVKAKPYNIKDKSLTNITKYLFYIELENSYNESMKKSFRLLQNFDLKNNEFDNPNVYLGDVNYPENSYNAIKGDKERSYIYHVLIDTRCPNFERAMVRIRESVFYINEYVYGDMDSNKIVVLLNSTSKKRVELCVEGRFDELFKEKEYYPLVKRPHILLTYFDISLNELKYYFTKESKVLVGLTKLEIPLCEADRLIKEFNIDDEQTKRFLYQKHGYPQADILN